MNLFPNLNQQLKSQLASLHEISNFQFASSDHDSYYKPYICARYRSKNNMHDVFVHYTPRLPKTVAVCRMEQ